MHVAIDARHLGGAQHTGIGGYTTQLTGALGALSDSTTFELLTSGRTKPALDTLCSTRISHTHTSIANKHLTARQLLTHTPSLASLATTNPDLLFCPNLAIMPRPTIPYVLTVHDLTWKLFPNWYSMRMRLWHHATRPESLISGASGIIVPSTCTRDDLIRTYAPQAPIHVIAHGVEKRFTQKMTPQDFGTRSRLRLPKRFALFLGTLTARKNIEGIIRGMERYRARTKDPLPLLLAGGWGWQSASIKRLLADPQRQEWIRHLGPIQERDKPALYRAATVFVWPSWYEGFGLPVLEAMASGTPVITSAISSLPELCQDGTLLVQPGRPEELALALEHLLSSPKLQTHLVYKALARAESFSWEKSARATATLFPQCL